MFNISTHNKLNLYITKANNNLSSGNIEISAVNARKALEITVKILAINYIPIYKDKRYAEVNTYNSIFNICETLFNMGIMKNYEKELLHYIRMAGNTAAHPEDNKNKIDLKSSIGKDEYKIKLKHFIGFIENHLDKVSSSIIKDSNNDKTKSIDTKTITPVKSTPKTKYDKSPKPITTTTQKCSKSVTTHKTIKQPKQERKNEYYTVTVSISFKTAGGKPWYTINGIRTDRFYSLSLYPLRFSIRFTSLVRESLVQFNGAAEITIPASFATRDKLDSKLINKSYPLYFDNGADYIGDLHIHNISLIEKKY